MTRLLVGTFVIQKVVSVVGNFSREHISYMLCYEEVLSSVFFLTVALFNICYVLFVEGLVGILQVLYIGSTMSRVSHWPPTPED